MFPLSPKDYIVRRLQQENDQIAEDERLIEQYREETKIKRSEIEEMKSRYGETFKKVCKVSLKWLLKHCIWF